MKNLNLDTESRDSCVTLVYVQIFYGYKLRVGSLRENKLDPCQTLTPKIFEGST